MNVAPPVSASTFVIAAVSDVFPWSTCPIVPPLQSGFVRSNFAFDMPSVLNAFPVSIAYGTIPGPAVARFGAGDGNRTHVASLEGWSSTIELHPRPVPDPRAAQTRWPPGTAVRRSDP